MAEHLKTVAFKQCPCCNYIWPQRGSFLKDPKIELIGYQANFSQLQLGLFLFNHNTLNCGTTIALEAARFQDLYQGPVYSTPLTSTEQCPEYCLNQSDLRSCPARCACAYIREILQIIKRWPKSET